MKFKVASIENPNLTFLITKKQEVRTSRALDGSIINIPQIPNFMSDFGPVNYNAETDEYVIVGKGMLRTKRID